MSNQLKTLTEIINSLTKEGYTEDFKAFDERIKGLYNKKDYKPTELLIEESYRFEGETNPADQSTLFKIKAVDGTKGTMTMSNNYESSQNEDLIRQIPMATD